MRSSPFASPQALEPQLIGFDKALSYQLRYCGDEVLVERSSPVIRDLLQAHSLIWRISCGFFGAARPCWKSKPQRADVFGCGN